MSMEHPYLFFAYALIWVGLFVYLRRLLRGQAELRRELERLKQQLPPG
ncbi:MAG TPA: CcmD family protein [Acidobacteriota bacterium]|jgi:CcmD family protein